jgi:asparagine synthase (glutamine-hydrolysing)
MCGIAGIYNYKQGDVSCAEIKKMTRAIKHRGPDGEGVWVKDNVGLGHRRLSIVDLSEKGKQPIFNENKSIWLVCNGEIYNFKELKKELIKEGHKFGSKSDNEVIVHLYEKYGTEFVKKINGMFAIAIWDANKQRLIIARDRLGIKPLYYYISRQGVIFSSEIKGILAHPLFRKEIDFESLHYYFFHNNIPAPKTIFKNIYSVLPAELLIFSKNYQDPRKEKYWQLVFSEDNIEDESEATKHLLNLLEISIKSHMVSDVPMGVALSGGIDSSIIVALLSRYTNKPIMTYSFSFQNDTLVKKKDFEMAGNIARLFKTDHHSFVLKPQDLMRNLDKIVQSFDMPISTFAFDYYLCQKATRDVKVIFTGDGTEELFGKYWNHRLAQSMAHLLSFVNKRKDYINLEREFIKKYSQIIPQRAWQFSELFAFKKEDSQKLYSNFLLNKTRKYDVYNYLFECFKHTTAKNFFNKVLEIDTNNFLVNHTLTIIDRVSMINSVEIRPPFLDYHLVEYVASLPARLKSRQGVTKYILKQVAKKIIPENMINKFQSGVTGPPISKWLLFEMESYVKDILAPRNLKKHNLFNKEYIFSMLKEHYRFKSIHKSHENYSFSYPEKNHTIKIWKLLIFQLWWEKYFS